MKFDLTDVKQIVDTFDPNVPTGDPFLDMRYQEQIDLFGHPTPYWRLFYRLGELLRPGPVVELGAWRGTGAAHWAPWARNVTTIDHHSDPGDDVNERHVRECCHVYRNLFYLKGWTWDVVDRVVDGIDVLFIDSWHHYDKAMRDWEAYRPKLAAEALVICDDLVESPPCLVGMEQFWAEISAGREAFVTERGHQQYPMGFMKWTV